MLLAETQVTNAELVSKKPYTLWMYQSQGEAVKEGISQRTEIPAPNTAMDSVSLLPAPLLLLQREQPLAQPALGLPCHQRSNLSHVSHLDQVSREYFLRCRDNIEVAFIKPNS